MEKFGDSINFGISLSTISSLCLRMYFPLNLNESIKMNALEFFNKNLSIDINNQNIIITEYVQWIDPTFIDNLEKCKDYLPQEFIKFVVQNQQFNKEINKFDWKLSYVNFKNLQTLD